MTVERIKSLPYPEKVDSIENIGAYLHRLYTSLNEETTERIEDFDILKLNNVPWVDVQSYNSFSDAVDGIGSEEKYLLISNEQAITANKIVPSNIHVNVLRSGSFTSSNSSKVTFNSYFESGLFRIFKGNLVVEFGAGSISEFHPEWFGNAALAAQFVSYGRNAGNMLVTGLGNTFVGIAAGYATTSGWSLDAFGQQALASNTSGYENVAVGITAMEDNTIGHGNAAFGTSALANNTSGNFNTALGVEALIAATTADNNTAVGASALVLNTTGPNNVAVGGLALGSNLVGANNVAVGLNAGWYSLGSGNTLVGMQAGQGVVNVSTYANNSILGYLAGHDLTTGGYNSFFGTNAGHANSSGQHNSFYGNEAGLSVTTGIRNTIIGSMGGQDLTTGSHNILLGYGINVPAGATSANTLNIGNIIYGTTVDGSGDVISTGNVGIKKENPGSSFAVAGLPAYANNAAAIVGGLTAGDFYRTNADPDPICVVH